MTLLGLTLVGLTTVFFVYAYVVYPAILALWASLTERGSGADSDPPFEWPTLHVSLAAYNEEAQIRGALEALLATDYPADRRRVLVISDASTDRTDDIVLEYAEQGVELLRLPSRGGKTAAENAGAKHVDADIVLNTDASTRLLPESVKQLVRVFADPTVGVASGRNRSVGAEGSSSNLGETAYVGYEMGVRSLETRTGSIVGASGCFYAIRSELHLEPLPEFLSRDFASALVAAEHGYRSVSVDDAVCLVPRTGSLRTEFRRKRRTMARGLETLWFKRRLLNPFCYRSFAWKLFSHKLCRWLASLFLPLGIIGLALLAWGSTWPRAVLAPLSLWIVLGLAALLWPASRRPPRIIAICGYVLLGSVAAVLAWAQALRGERGAIWEPTRRSQIG
jgi:cellulose synthase/poly-beta-1,6-N-acetylglucosamine synthase-like glycosyltransferase